MVHALGRVAATLKQGALRALLGLPPGAVRRLAGPPVEVDGQRLDPETQWLLRLQRLAREPAVETLPLAQGREALRRQARIVGGDQPIGLVHQLAVPGADGPLPARLYVPRSGVGARRSAVPLLFFVHGGGMVYGDLDCYDAVCRFLAEQADVRVLSVGYRLAPEHPFPAAVEDCRAAYQAVIEDAGRYGADPERVAVGGDSAGGCLSAVTALYAAEAGVPCAYQMLVYPSTDMAEAAPSRHLFRGGYYLTERFIERATAAYLPPGTDPRDPRVSPLHTEKIPDGLAPAHVVTAGFDPLRDEGEAYARLLADAGVPVQQTRFPGMIHGFLSMVGAGRSARAAVAEVAGRLRTALH